jgi:hypothetical protein
MTASARISPGRRVETDTAEARKKNPKIAAKRIVSLP